MPHLYTYDGCVSVYLLLFLRTRTRINTLALVGPVDSYSSSPFPTRMAWISEYTGTPSIDSMPCLSTKTTQATGSPPRFLIPPIVSRIVVPLVMVSSTT